MDILQEIYHGFFHGYSYVFFCSFAILSIVFPHVFLWIFHTFSFFPNLFPWNFPTDFHRRQPWPRQFAGPLAGADERRPGDEAAHPAAQVPATPDGGRGVEGTEGSGGPGSCWKFHEEMGCFLKYIPRNHENWSGCWWFGCHFLFSHILGMSSSQLTFIFFRRVQTTNQTKIDGL